jgi:GNAT superfamily N-acetyltransferase
MSEGTKIRQARAADAAELAALATELGYPSIATDVERRLPPLLESPEHLVLVAAGADDRAVGWLHAAIHRGLTNDVRVEIVGLVVAAERRGSGIGARLLAEAEKWARQAGASQVRVRSNVARERAHGFYLRAGYALAKTSHQFIKELGRE